MLKGIIVCSLLLIILFLFLCSIPKKNRHKRKIAKSKRVLNKLNTPDFDNNGKIISYLRKIDPYVFEELLLSALAEKDFKIIRNERYSHDGGIDGRAYNKDGALYLIQAKRYSSYVSIQHLYEFKQKVGKNRGLFIHTGKTGKDVYNRFENTNVEIISGTKLINLILQSNKEKKHI
jgi:restriction system protein